MSAKTTRMASGDSVCSPFSLPGLPDRDRLPISSFIRAVCPTELCIEACQAEKGRITGFAFAHSLWIAVCDFRVGLRRSLDKFTFVKYIRDVDSPLFVGSIHES